METIVLNERTYYIEPTVDEVAILPVEQEDRSLSTTPNAQQIDNKPRARRDRMAEAFAGSGYSHRFF